MIDLNDLYVTATLNGRTAEAEAIEKAMAFAKETREWAACLKCGAAFDDIAGDGAAELRHHYRVSHPHRY